MNIGDVVLITKSFGSGEDYEGHIGVLYKEGQWTNDGVIYNSIVRLADDYTYVCDCIPTTELLRALY